MDNYFRNLQEMIRREEEQMTKQENRGVSSLTTYSVTRLVRRVSIRGNWNDLDR